MDCNQSSSDKEWGTKILIDPVANVTPVHSTKTIIYKFKHEIQKVHQNIQNGAAALKKNFRKSVGLVREGHV